MATETVDNKPQRTIVDALTGAETVVELTADEIAQLPQEETPTEVVPASDDAGAPSTDAG